MPLINNYFKTSSMRAPQAPQTVFASEQLIDELAYALEDGSVRVPAQEHLDDRPEPLARRARGRGEARELEADGGRVEPVEGERRHGRGIGLGSYAGSQAGVVADIEVNKSTGKILVKHAYVTQVSGLGVSLEGLESQMMGSMMMGTSRTLHEGVAFDTKRVTSLDWVTYPILRFKDHPNITYTVTQRLDLPSSGAGEPPDAAIPAAIANAFFDATGVRIRETPLTPARVRAVLKAAGK